MKIVYALMLTCTTAVSALAGDSAEMLRDRLIFCNQFVIRDPDPGIRLGYHHDCHINDRDDDRGVPWRY